MRRILLKYLLTLVIAVTLSYAIPSPTDPYGDSVWKKGQQVTIKWVDSGSPPSSSLKGITIQLMTGPDIGQIYLTTLGSGLSTTSTSLTVTVPDISTFGYPPGKIYFLMFCDSANPSTGLSWTTRFTILDDSSQPPVTYTPGTPWTITKSGGSPQTSSASSNSTQTDSKTTNTDTSSTSTDSTDSAASSKSTESSSNSASNVVIVTSYVTGSDTTTAATDTPNTPVVNPGPGVDSSPSTSDSMRNIMWNGGVLTMIAFVAFAFVI